MKRTVRWLVCMLLAVYVGRSTRAQEAPAAGDAKRRLGGAAEQDKATAELIVILKPGGQIDAVQARYGLVHKQALRGDARAHVFAAGTAARAASVKRLAEQDENILRVYENRRTDKVKWAFVPNDPYFHKETPTGWTGRGQWHLTNEYTGVDSRISGAWNRDVTGLGVKIGIVDDSLETAHPDLSANYSAGDSWDFGDDDADPNPVWTDDQHGISVAGVAAARGNNGIGVVGAAPFAGLCGLRIDFLNQTTAMFLDATLYRSSGANTNIKVKNHSYGVSIAYVAAAAETDALATSAAAGTIHVFAAGNERSSGSSGEPDSNKKQPQCSPDSVTVAALGFDGQYAYYSCFGANIVATLPSSDTVSTDSILTTDRSGALGYNTGSTDGFPDDSYTSLFGGTSSAAPLMSGIAALGKQAQPGLNTRFVKHLLARTCRIVDASDVSATSDGGWRVNTAGHHFNQNYGFGLVDAGAFVNAATQYVGVSALTTEETGTTAVGAAIPDNNAAGVSRTFTLSSNAPMEEILVTLDIDHTYDNDIEAYLISPNSYTSRVMKQYLSTGDDTGIHWTFSSHAFWGCSPQGTWTLRVSDRAAVDTGTWNSFGVTVRMGALVAAGGVTNRAPTNVLLSGATVAENQPAGTTVGTLSSQDPDAANTFTYSLVSGDVGSFTIAGSNLQTAASFDYEAKSSYSLGIRSTDQGGLSTQRVFAITVSNVNEAPTNIVLSGATVPESQPAGTTVGTLSSQDSDAGNTFTYSLVSGDLGAFTIAGSNLQTAISFDYEAQSSYSVGIRSTDQGGLSTQQLFAVSVTDVAEPPVTRIIRPSGNLAFGNVQALQTDQRVWTIHNDGNSALTVASVGYPPGFSGNWSGTIGAGGASNVTVTFAPVDTTVYAGSLIVNSDATAGTNTWPVSGAGTNPGVADLEILPTAPVPLVWVGGVPPDPRGTNAPFMLTYAMRNRGPASVLGKSHRYEVYLSEDAVFNTADRKLAQASLGSLALAPWQQVSKASGLVSAYFPSDLTAGKYNAGVHAVLQAAPPTDPYDPNNWMSAGTVTVAPKAVCSFPVSFPGKHVLVVKVDLESGRIESLVNLMAPTEISMGDLKPNRWYWVAFDVQDAAGVWQVAFATSIARFEGSPGRWIGAMPTQPAIAPYQVGPPTLWMLFERAANHPTTTYAFELESRQMVWGPWQQHPAGWVGYAVPRFDEWFCPYVADAAAGVWY